MSEVEMLDFEAFKERYEKVPVEEYPNNVREAVPDPVVSVHLLTYNHVDYIREAIESVLMQEVDFPMEIVLGDDDSSDGTSEICIEYAEQYPDLIRLQLHHRENNIELLGQPTHVFQYWYNTLSARGKYIAILSGDDYWTDPLKLHKQVSFLKKNPGFALSYHSMSRTVEAPERDERRQDQRRKNLSKKDLAVGPLIPPTTVVCRNYFSFIHPGFLTTMCEDRIVAGYLGKYGKAHYTKSVQPTKARGLTDSLHSSTKSHNKIKDFLKYTEILQEVHSSNEIISKKIDSKKTLLLQSMFYNYMKEKNYLKSVQVAKKILKRHTKNKDYFKIALFLMRAMKYFIERNIYSK